MKSLRFLLLMVVLSVSVLYLAGGLYSIEDKVLIEKTGNYKPQILFNHKSHSEEYGAACNDCHHGQESDTKEYKKCRTCHKERDQGHIINLKGAFHQQCHDCHRKNSGPKACGRCHKK